MHKIICWKPGANPTLDPATTMNYSDTCVGHPCYDLYGEAWAEQIKNGTINRYTLPFHSSFHVIWEANRRDSDKPGRGFILFSKEEHGELWVRMSYVRPAARRQGCYTRMFEALKIQAMELGCNRISGGTSVKNLAMQGAYAATGRVKVSETWTYEIPGAS